MLAEVVLVDINAGYVIHENHMHVAAFRFAIGTPFDLEKEKCVCQDVVCTITREGLESRGRLISAVANGG